MHATMPDDATSLLSFFPPVRGTVYHKPSESQVSDTNENQQNRDGEAGSALALAGRLRAEQPLGNPPLVRGFDNQKRVSSTRNDESLASFFDFTRYADPDESQTGAESAWSPQAPAADLFRAPPRPAEINGRSPAQAFSKPGVAEPLFDLKLSTERQGSLFTSADTLPFILTELAFSTEISLDVETTALSAYQHPQKLKKDTKIGGTIPLRVYEKQYGAGTDATPRCRVLAFRTDSGLRVAVDLDDIGWCKRSPGGLSNRRLLIRALSGKVWVGQNLLFDYTWLKTIEKTVRPRRIIDTMLLGTACHSDFMMKLHTAASGALLQVKGRKTHKYAREIYEYLLRRKKKTEDNEDDGVYSLYILALYHLGEKLDKSYQKPQNWAVSYLSPAHYEYSCGDIEAPPLIARRQFGLSDDCHVSELLAALDNHAGGSCYRVFEKALHGLVEMHRKGIYFSADSAARYGASLDKQRDAALIALFEIAPALAGHKDVIVAGGLTGVLKSAMAAELERLYHKPPPVSASDGKPLLGAAALKMHYGSQPLLEAWGKVQESVKRRAMLDDYVERAGRDGGRLHSIVSINTAAGRTASEDPNVQNAPRDEEFRACFEAPPPGPDGRKKKMLAIDYSSIEMVIAAGLAQRCYTMVREGLQALREEMFTGRKNLQKNSYDFLGRMRWLGWMLRGSSIIEDYLDSCAEHDHDTPIDVEIVDRPEMADGSTGFSDETMAQWAAHFSSVFVDWLEKVKRNGGFKDDQAEDRLTLPYATRNGLDTHMITAAATLRRSGEIDFGDCRTALDWLESKTPDERDALKKKYKKPRQKGKANNFGLLYGMQYIKLHAYGQVNYGIDWSLEEAAESRVEWFNTYPEIGLWHFCTRHGGKVKNDVVDIISETVKLRDDGARFFVGTTLSGRTVCSPDLNAALNYQDQGTGAEIALDAFGQFYETPVPYAEADTPVAATAQGPGLFDRDIPKTLVALEHTMGARLVAFVHDEFIFEEYEDMIDELESSVYKLMTDAAKPYLDQFDIFVGAEGAKGDHWIH